MFNINLRINSDKKDAEVYIIVIIPIPRLGAENRIMIIGTGVGTRKIKKGTITIAIVANFRFHNISSGIL